MLPKKKKHTFISTGMSSKKDIDNAVKIFRENNCSFELMHCVSTYPMKDEDANLTTINQLKKEYKCDVGYSGHENGVLISLVAVMQGITSLERHITLDRAMYGSDQAASLEIPGMKNLTSSIGKLLVSLGSPSLGKIIDDELPIAKKLRAILIIKLMIKNKIELENQIKDNINAHLSILNISDDILNVIKKIHQKIKKRRQNIILREWGAQLLMHNI